MRKMTLLILTLIGLSTFSSVYAQEFTSDMGTDSQTQDTLDNTYPAVEPRIPVMPRPSISGPNDAKQDDSSAEEAPAY